MWTNENTRRILNELDAGAGACGVTIAVTPDLVLRDFQVSASVLPPQKTASVFLASWLATRSELYQGKRVLDMGCGSGIQGIVVALKGAAAVVLSDVCSVAVSNTRMNIARWELEHVTEVTCGDLFEPIEGRFDLIVFNHPFFSSAAGVNRPSRAVFDEGQLIHRFLSQAHAYLDHGGSIVMPYFHPAGTSNDPALQGPVNGYVVSAEVSRRRMALDWLTGEVSVYRLSPCLMTQQADPGPFCGPPETWR